MEQLPRLLQKGQKHTTNPSIESRSNPEPPFHIRKYASPNSIYTLACEELSILSKLPQKRRVQPLKIVFKSQRLRRSHPTTWFSVLLQRPSRKGARLFDNLKLHARPRTHSSRCLNPAPTTAMPPTAGLGIFLEKEFLHIVSQKRDSVLNLPIQFGSCIPLAKERLLSKAVQHVNICFLTKFGYTGKVHIETLPFDIPTRVYAKNVHEFLEPCF